MLRKQILTEPSPRSASHSGEKDIAALATVLVTSETPDDPIDHAFDTQRGPGGSRWVAGEAGDQTLIVAFDMPQAIHRIGLEIEERDVSRVQELEVALSYDGGSTYHQVRRQEYTFSPSGATFEREEWDVAADGVTHVRLWIRPDKGGGPCRATLSSLVLQ
jgi:hypothetical protein